MRLPALLRPLVSLRRRLFALFAVVIALALVPTFVVRNTEENAIAALERIVAVDMRVSELALGSVATFGRARRYEKDFLLYHAEFGFKEARARYAVRVETSVADLRRNLAEIETLVTDAESRTQVAEIRRAVDAYLVGFLAMVELREALALPHWGLAARLEQAVGELPLLLPTASEALIATHRAARELATDPGEAEYARFVEALDVLQTGPASRLPSGAREKLAVSLARGRVRAVLLRNLGQQIAERRAAYLKAAQAVEPELDKLHLARLRAGQAALSQIRRSNLEAGWTSITAAIVVVTFALALSAWVATRVGRNVAAFVAMTQEIADGRFDAASPETGTVEFAQLNHALSAMSKKLRASLAAIGAHSRELTTTNMALSEQIAERTRVEQQLRSREAETKLLLASTGEAIYGIDTQGRCTFCNVACLRVLGYADESELLGRNMHELIHYAQPDGSPYPVENCHIYRAFRDGVGTHRDDEVLWRKDGTSFLAEYWSYPLRRDGELRGAVVTFKDITGRRRREDEVNRQAALDRLLENLAAVANQAQTPTEAMRECLRLICKFTGWSIGHAALTEKQESYARATTDVWHTAEPERFAEFIETSTNYHYSLVRGKLIRKVFVTKQPTWVKEFDPVKNFGRGDARQRAGLASGIALPVLVQGEVLGFLEFFSDAPADPDPVLLAALARASGHLGRLVERTAFEEQLQQLNTELERRVGERTTQLEHANRALVQGNREITLLSEMTNLLQTAASFEEAATILTRFLGELFTPHAGAVYLTSSSLNYLDLLVQWGDAIAMPGFAPDDCWGLRRGQIHSASDPQTDLVCAHARRDEGGHPYMCVPLMAQVASLGLLHVVFAPGTEVGADSGAGWRQFAERVANQITLALANLRLRQTLREQSVRDALTGLYNRRYLEESFNREIARAVREKQPLAVFMLDVDHFKQFNDQYGHEAGDAVLRAFGHVLRQSVRTSDIVCRFGGEEFTVVLAGATEPTALDWAGRLMKRIRAMEVRLEGQQLLPHVTVSAGLAVYPRHGADVETLLQAADHALYAAKHAGRDRITVSEAVAPRTDTGAQLA